MAKKTDDNPAPAAPAPPVVEESSADLQKLVEAQDAAIKELTAKVEALSRAPAVDPIKELVSSIKGPDARELNEEGARRSKERDDALEDRRKELEAGAKKFKIGLEGEPMMAITVGGSSQGDAEAKYRDWFGIRGSTRAMEVTLID